jgi:hypothetical protein
MNLLVTGIASICLAGCSAASPQAQNEPSQKADDKGAWQIVPVAGVPVQREGEYFWSAWRINATTGDTEFCMFDSGDPAPKPTTIHPNPGGLTCSTPNRPGQAQ